MPAPISQTEGAAELVERARAGDQNAMAMLAMVGERAREGVPKARSAFGAVQKYISEHPAPLDQWEEGAQLIGVLKNPENPDDGIFETLLSLPQYQDARLINTACVVLSHGYPWSKERIHGIDALMEAGSDPQRQYRFGIAHAGNGRMIGPAMSELPDELVGFLCAGHCIGTARKLQLLRRPDTSPGILCKDVEWELGC
jgi:hypothetical protein